LPRQLCAKREPGREVVVRKAVASVVRFKHVAVYHHKICAAQITSRYIDDTGAGAG
jgi:hypothetical protein